MGGEESRGARTWKTVAVLNRRPSRTSLSCSKQGTILVNVLKSESLSGSLFPNRIKVGRSSVVHYCI